VRYSNVGEKAVGRTSSGEVRDAMTMPVGAICVAEGFAAIGGVARGADLFEQRVPGLCVR
jgi:hypothetical protein